MKQLLSSCDMFKRSLLLLIFSSLSLFVSKAQNDTTYVIFTDVENYKSAESSISHLAPEPNEDFDPTRDRTPCHFFEVCNRVAGFYRTYIYENPVAGPDTPIVTKPVSFLQTINYMDWDTETAGLNLKQLFELIDNLNKHSVIYFIDRAEIKDEIIKLYPVKEVKANF